MDDRNQLRIAQLLCSRLCHDLISPIGAINNGLELLSEDQSILAEAISLIGQSNQQAAGRLAYYRLAFGGAEVDEQVDFSELHRLMENFFADGKIFMDWDRSYSPNEYLVSKLFAKLILNLAIVASEALPRGGTLSISPKNTDSNRFQIALTGQGCALDGELPDLLTGKVSASDVDVKRVVPYLCSELASQLNISLGCETIGDDTARIYSTTS